MPFVVQIGKVMPRVSLCVKGAHFRASSRLAAAKVDKALGASREGKPLCLSVKIAQHLSAWFISVEFAKFYYVHNWALLECYHVLAELSDARLLQIEAVDLRDGDQRSAQGLEVVRDQSPGPAFIERVVQVCNFLGFRCLCIMRITCG